MLTWQTKWNGNKKETIPSTKWIRWFEQKLESFLLKRNDKKTSGGQFYQHWMCSFYVLRSQKCKKNSQIKQFFALSGSVCVKATHKFVGEIYPWKEKKDGQSELCRKDIRKRRRTKGKKFRRIFRRRERNTFVDNFPGCSPQSNKQHCSRMKMKNEYVYECTVKSA